MRISFFEEFPTPKNLEKVALLLFPSTVYLAAPSVARFNEVRETLQGLNPHIEAAYWPILAKSYWVSPFCDSEELRILLGELQAPHDAKRVLIDLEMPVLSKGQVLRNLGSFHSNKKMIQTMFSLAGNGVVTAEYPSLGDSSQGFLESLGLSVPMARFRHTKTVMFYTTFIKHYDVQDTIKRQIIRLHREYSGCIHVGLGTIAPGVFGNEGILPPRELGHQLRFFRDEGIPEVTLYRLGGLTEEYLDTIMEVVPS